MGTLYMSGIDGAAGCTGLLEILQYPHATAFIVAFSGSYVVIKFEQVRKMKDAGSHSSLNRSS